MSNHKIQCEVLSIGPLKKPTLTSQTQNLRVKDDEGREFWLQCYNNTDLLRGIKAGDRVNVDYAKKGKVLVIKRNMNLYREIKKMYILHDIWTWKPEYLPSQCESFYQVMI